MARNWIISVEKYTFRGSFLQQNNQFCGSAKNSTDRGIVQFLVICTVQYLYFMYVITTNKKQLSGR